MTDRIQGFSVVLNKTMRIDDAQHILDAISLMKGVKKVSPVIVEHTDLYAAERALCVLKETIIRTLDKLTVTDVEGKEATQWLPGAYWQEKCLDYGWKVKKRKEKDCDK